MKNQDKLKNLLETLAKLVEDRSPNIAECSLSIEHKKYKLANQLKKQGYPKGVYLNLVNTALLFCENIYSVGGRFLDSENKNAEEDIKEFKDCTMKVTDEFIEVMKKMKEEFSNSKQEEEDEE